MFRLRLLVLAFVAILVAGQPLRAVSVKSLAPVYRHWLTEEVNYIIEGQERTEFLTLKTDAERDAFMQSFWAARNPDPGSEINSYKEEHYRRLAYANEHFGNYARHDGWSTDQGMIYITLGEPKQKITYPSRANVRPISIWFYQSPTPALPSYFSVMFYKRSTGEDYAIYSPYQDGPNRLVTGLESMNDQARSLQQLRKAFGGEVARTAISLIPSEPVNLTEYSPSMMSDALLANIRGLADNPLEIARVNRYRREKVTASILSGSAPPEISYTVTRDDHDRMEVEYYARFPQPDSSLVGALKAGGTGYDMTLQQHITTESGSPVYDTVTVIAAGGLLPSQVNTARTRVFAAEDRLPLQPGSYVVQSTLTNKLNLEAHRTSTKVVVPAIGKGLSVSTPVAYAGRPVHLEGDRVPFSYADVRFPPQGVGTVTLHSGDVLRCVFQLWLPKTSDGKVKAMPIAMHYYYGSLNSGGQPLDIADETITPTDADAAGNLVTGHAFTTTNLVPGSYRAIIRAAQPGSAPAFGIMSLRIVAPDVTVDNWSAYGPPQTQQDGMKRALSAEATGDFTAAIVLLREELNVHPQNVDGLGRLAMLLARQRRVTEVAALVDRPAFHDAVDMPTLTLVTEALVTAGKPDRAMDLLNRQSHLQPLNTMLYTQLATLDDRAGKRAEGDLARKQAAEQRP